MTLFREQTEDYSVDLHIVSLLHLQPLIFVAMVSCGCYDYSLRALVREGTV